MALQKLTNEQGYLKAGFLGFAKSGKSFTAAKLAIGTIKALKLDGPVALFDTESGSNFIAEMVKAETGKDLLGVRARSFDALMQFAQDCMKEKVSVAIIDSISHPWVELCDSYLDQLNVGRRSKNWQPLQKLEFTHWSAIKKIWEQWPNFFLNSPLHCILCGRAGYEWEMNVNEETGRKELEKVGIKMKTEKELGFEPSLLVQMERDQVPDGEGGFRMVHIATVLGDRFNVIDGATATNPDFSFFQPHVMKLKPGAHAPVVIASTATGADAEGQGDFERERKQRTILCEEIQGAIVSVHPGQSAEEKKAKADLLFKVFGTRSWTKVEGMDSGVLRERLELLKVELGIESPKSDDDLPYGGDELDRIALSCPVIGILSHDEYTKLQELPKSNPRTATQAQSQVLLERLREGTQAQGLSLGQPTGNCAYFSQHDGSDLRISGQCRLVGQGLLGFQGTIAFVFVRLAGNEGWQVNSSGGDQSNLPSQRGTAVEPTPQAGKLRRSGASGRVEGDPLPGSPSGEHDDLCLKVRQLMQESKIRESVLLGYLTEIGVLEGGSESLEEANQKNDQLLPMTIAMWPDIAAKINEALGRNA